MARRTKQEAMETRESILRAALDIIYEKGYARSTFVDIAKEIKLTKGAVYWHFKSKPDLFLGLAKKMEDKIEETLKEAFSAIYTIEDLERVLFDMIRLISEDDDLRKYYTIVFFRMEWTEELLSVREYFDAQDKEMIAQTTALLEYARSKGGIPEGRDVRHLAVAISGIFDGLLGRCLACPKPELESLFDSVRAGLDAFFTGMGVKAGTQGVAAP